MGENFVAVVVKGLGGDVGVFEADDEGGAVVGALDQAVDVMDVEFGFEEGGEDAGEAAFVGDFDGENLGFGVGEVVIDKKFTGFVEVVDDEAKNGAVGGVDDGEGDDVNVVSLEEGGEVGEAADAVFDKDGELADRVVGDGGAGHDGEGLKRVGRWRQM